jgi:myo-inositol-1(or 4)-monophosphatase
MSLNDLESSVIARFRAGDAPPPRAGEVSSAWVEFGLHVLLEAAQAVRGSRGGEADVSLKTDGSPVTQLETRVEERITSRLGDFDPDAVLVGEELGGVLVDRGMALAVDPVDGTWAFLTGTETYSTTLALFRDGVPVLGMVSNPATGQIGYAAAGRPTRLLQLSVYGEADYGATLPGPGAETGPLLVNVHPGRRGSDLVGRLYRAWESETVRMVRSPGGSPAWALVEAARGDFVYVNLWSKRPASPYDLAAGILLMKGAGGMVTDLDGRAVDPVSHSGPFIAAVSEDRRAVVTALVREAAGVAPGT